MRVYTEAEIASLHHAVGNAIITLREISYRVRADLVTMPPTQVTLDLTRELGAQDHDTLVGLAVAAVMDRVAAS